MLEGRVALVTGAASQRGMGRAMALGLARAGADVVVSDVARHSLVHRVESDDWQGLDSIVEEIERLGRRAWAIPADLSDGDDAERLGKEAVGAVGRIDVLVNNAAAPGEQSASWELGRDLWDRTVAVNLTAAFLLSQAVVPGMIERRWGRIVNIASTLGKKPWAGKPAYNATKSALIGLTRSLALELGPRGITVNAVCPGLTTTDRAFVSDEAVSAMDDVAKLVDSLVTREVPLGRAGRPAEPAALVTFLASSEGEYITGQAVNVDGGWYMA
jgi:3-oxoacyl-[acyl-carrier protein] reductase